MSSAGSDRNKNAHQALLVTATLIVIATTTHYLFRRRRRDNKTMPHLSNMSINIAVVGAGSIGTLCGLALAKALSQNENNNKVVLVGQKSFLVAVQSNDNKLRVQDKCRRTKEETFAVHVVNSSSGKNNYDDKNDGSNIFVTDDIQQLQHLQCDLILVATKTTATQEVGLALALALPLDSKATIVSFQNGMGNADLLRQALLEHKHVHVAASMVNFNAYWHHGTNLFYKTTDGGVTMELPEKSSEETSTIGNALPPKQQDHAMEIHSSRIQALAQALTQHHISSKTVSCQQLKSTQYSKLLINMFNAINALAGLSTPATLEQQGYRRVWGAAMAEGLAVYKALGITTATFRGLPPTLLPLMQHLPDALFWVVFRYMAKMDDTAKSSMLQDFQRHPPRTNTEVDDLSGEIVRLGSKAKVPTPVNAALVSLVHAASAAGKGSPCMTAQELLVQVGLEPPKE